MATTDERVDKLETRFLTPSEQFAATMAKVDTFIDEMRDFKTEMRDRDNQRAEDMRRLHDRQDALQAKTDAKFDALNKQIQDTWRQTMIGVGGMIVAMSALLLAALK